MDMAFAITDISITLVFTVRSDRIPGHVARILRSSKQQGFLLSFYKGCLKIMVSRLHALPGLFSVALFRSRFLCCLCLITFAMQHNVTWKLHEAVSDG